MTDSLDDNIYARSAILRWAESILHGEYTSFTDIAAKDIAVLLHAIFNSHSDAKGEETATPVVSLHDIQFSDNLNSMTRLLNAKRVLSLVQALSSSPTTGVNSAEGTRLVSTGVGNMTACAWLEGKAFVEELKMWRWIRDEAFKRGLEVAELEKRVRLFLGTAVTEGSRSEEGGETAPLSKKRPRGDDVSGITLPCDVESGAKETSRAPVCGEYVSSHTSSAVLCTDGNAGGKVAVKMCSSNETKPSNDSQGSDEKAARSLLNITCDGMEAAPGLLNVLEGVVKELNERKAAACEAATPRCSEDGSKNELHTVENTRGSGPTAGECSSCPSLYASAIKQNYVAIERLETLRKMAVAACLNRDAEGLLGILALA